MTQRFCRVFVDSAVLGLDRPFDYAVPDRLAGRVALGSIVRVPLHGRRIRGFVVEMLDAPAVADPRPLSALVSNEPLFGRDEIGFARWLADRYVTTLGVVLHEAVPGRYSAPAAAKAPAPSAARAPAWLASGALESSKSVVCEVPSIADEPALLAAAAGKAAQSGRRSLIICPRVAVAETVAEAIEGAVLLHGDQRPSMRSAVWAGARRGDVHVVVGGRAALLAPLPDLGLVAVASAHDRSLRSERTPRVNAVVAARRRAELSGAMFLASSPAPPLDLLADTDVVVPTRRARIRVEVVRPRGGPVTPRVSDVIDWAINERSDVLVFAGRLGGVLRLRCNDCGWYPRCPECETGLPAEPDEDGKLRCRVCPGSTPVPDECPSCGGALAGRGWGHTRIASAVEALGRDAPVVTFVRGDTPTVPRGPAIVVGTTAAVHGWARPFGAICVADLDQLLGRADFRAAEHALQMLHELAAALRPGGRFLVQTREPEHHAVQAFTRRSFSYFAERELPLRREAGYPPYGEIALVDAADTELDALAPTLRAAGAAVLGPISARRGLSRILVRAPSVTPLLEPLRAFALEHPRSRIEIDPVDVA